MTLGAADPGIFYEGGYYWMVYAGLAGTGGTKAWSIGLAYAITPTGAWTKYGQIVDVAALVHSMRRPVARVAVRWRHLPGGVWRHPLEQCDHRRQGRQLYADGDRWDRNLCVTRDCRRSPPAIFERDHRRGVLAR